MKRMTIRAMAAAVILTGVAVVAVGLDQPGIASEPLDSSHEAKARTGKHQFYVWCTGAEDFVDTAEGASAEAAQQVLWERLKGEGRTTCWPVWQGLTQ